MAEPLDFSGRVALVTGGSRGIGAGIVRALDRAGARCVVNYVADSQGRNEAEAREVATGLHDALLVECDVGDDAKVAAMMARIRQERGGLDIVINNAGILRDRTIKKMTAEEWDSVLRVNLSGAFNCLRHATPLLRGGGRVVSVASVSAQLGLFGQANYAASKAGVIALTRVAAREFARQGITVNAVAPGFVDTEMTRSMPAEVTRKFLEQVPLGRLGQIDDVVAAVMFLCSAQSGYITGQVIHVNGGFYMG